MRGAVEGAKHCHKDGHGNGEDDLLGLADFTGLLHHHLALFLGGQQLHEGRLNQGNQRHVGVSRTGDGTQQPGRQLRGKEDRRRAIRAADDADGSGLRAGEAKDNGQEEGHKHAHLGRSAHEHTLGVGDQGAKVGHRADPQENEAGIQTGLHADVEKVQQAAVGQDMAIAVVEFAVFVHKCRPQLLVVHPTHGQVAEQATKGNAHQQKGLKFLDNSQIEKHTGNGNHHQALPAVAHKEGVDAGVIPEP